MTEPDLHPAPPNLPDDGLARLRAAIAASVAAGSTTSRSTAPLACTEPAPGRHAADRLVRSRRLRGWFLDRVPAPLQGRLALAPSTFAVLVITIALGLAVSAWWALQAQRPVSVVPTSSGPVSTEAEQADGQIEVSVGEPSVVTSSPMTPTTSATTAGREATGAAGTVTVDVVGDVRKPGIAVLPTGSRVIDAIRAAGGLTRKANRAAINMAAPLRDGQQVLVGGPQRDPVGSGAPIGDEMLPTGPDGAILVNLNTADSRALDSLPGVGPVTAAAILSWRDSHGGFTSVDQLLSVDGIGEVTLARLRPLVTL